MLVAIYSDFGFANAGIGASMWTFSPDLTSASITPGSRPQALLSPANRSRGSDTLVCRRVSLRPQETPHETHIWPLQLTRIGHASPVTDIRERRAMHSRFAQFEQQIRSDLDRRNAEERGSHGMLNVPVSSNAKRDHGAKLSTPVHMGIEKLPDAISLLTLSDSP